jgi:hypothetical protein
MNEPKTEIPPIELTTPIGVTDAPITTVETSMGDVTIVENEHIKDIEVEVVTPEAPAPDHAARTHHKNSPSKLPYLGYCPGFKSDETGDKDAAEQGTRLHEYMDTIVQNWTKDSSKSMLQYLDDLCNNVAVDTDERALLVFCVRELVDWLSRSGAEVVQEIRVEIHRPDGTLATAGHLDLLLVFANGMGLLIDYKFGWLRVKDAKDNEQGLAYALGCFEKFPNLKRIGIMFLQPRLGLKSSAVLDREKAPEALNSVLSVIERAEFVQKRGFTAETIPLLTPGSQCMYCEHSKQGTCPARLGVLVRTAQNMLPMEFPSNWSPEAITTPEQAAMARYAVERIEDFLDGIKQRAKEIAIATEGQKIACQLANGEEVVYKIEQHKYDRSLGKALDVAKALENILTLEEVLGCAELKLGALEEVTANAIYEQINDSEKKELAAYDERMRIAFASGQASKSAVEKGRKAIRDKYSGQRVTKKAAKEQFAAILTTQNLLTREDGTVPQLHRDKSGVKQLTSSNK